MPFPQPTQQNLDWQTQQGIDDREARGVYRDNPANAIPWGFIFCLIAAFFIVGYLASKSNPNEEGQ